MRELIIYGALSSLTLYYLFVHPNPTAKVVTNGQVVAKVLSIKGNSGLLRGLASPVWQKVKEPVDIYSYDTLATPDDSEIIVLLEDSSTLVIRPNSQIKFPPKTRILKENSVAMLFGSVEFSKKNLSKANLSIRLPTAKLTMVGKAAVVVNVSADGSEAKIEKNVREDFVPNDVNKVLIQAKLTEPEEKTLLDQPVILGTTRAPAAVPAVPEIVAEKPAVKQPPPKPLQLAAKPMPIVDPPPPKPNQIQLSPEAGEYLSFIKQGSGAAPPVFKLLLSGTFQKDLKERVRIDSNGEKKDTDFMQAGELKLLTSLRDKKQTYAITSASVPLKMGPRDQVSRYNPAADYTLHLIDQSNAIIFDRVNNSASNQMEPWIKLNKGLQGKASLRFYDEGFFRIVAPLIDQAKLADAGYKQNFQFIVNGRLALAFSGPSTLLKELIDITRPELVFSGSPNLLLGRYLEMVNNPGKYKADKYYVFARELVSFNADSFFSEEARHLFSSKNPYVFSSDTYVLTHESDLSDYP
jgi:hypothetical protein